MRMDRTVWHGLGVSDDSSHFLLLSCCLITIATAGNTRYNNCSGVNTYKHHVTSHRISIPQHNHHLSLIICRYPPPKYSPCLAERDNYNCTELHRDDEGTLLFNFVLS